MKDFKIDTVDAVFSMLSAMQFRAESMDGRKKEENQELFRKAVAYMPVIELKNGIYYRSRIIEPKHGKDEGIIRENGIPVTGFNDDNSGVPSEKYVKKNGRVNHVGEPVLYLAEDIVTSCKEQKPKRDDFLSVAECRIENSIKVMDFTIMVEEGLGEIFSDETVGYFKDNFLIDIRSFYIFIKNYLTSPNYAEQDYIVSLAFLDIVKKRNDISGVRYNSYYSNGHNVALWDANKNSKCTNSRVIKEKDISKC